MDDHDQSPSKDDQSGRPVIVSTALLVLLAVLAIMVVIGMLVLD